MLKHCQCPCKSLLKTGHICWDIAESKLACLSIYITDTTPFLLMANIKTSFWTIRSIDKLQVSFQFTWDVTTCTTEYAYQSINQSINCIHKLVPPKNFQGCRIWCCKGIGRLWNANKTWERKKWKWGCLHTGEDKLRTSPNAAQIKLPLKLVAIMFRCVLTSLCMTAGVNRCPMSSTNMQWLFGLTLCWECRYIAIYLCISQSSFSLCFSVYQLIWLAISRSFYQSIFLSVDLSISRSVYQSSCLSVELSISRAVYQPVCLSVDLSISRSVYQSLF